MKNSSSTQQNYELYTDEEQEKPIRQWNFTLSTVVSSTSTGSGSDALGFIELDPTETRIATGGIARKIRVYNLTSLFPNQSNHEIALLDHVNACDYYICAPAKLSSLRWKPNSNGRLIGTGDYDGVVTEYDLERKIPIFERDEHGGRRIWSVDYSHCNPTVGASGSDDGTMQMWDSRCDDADGGRGIATVQPGVGRSSVCCVEFDPFVGELIAVGCADRKAYVYDVRKLDDPVIRFDGHSKTVTYVKFLDVSTIVSAGTDGCLKLWSMKDSSVVRTYKGHVNTRNFVGLSVWRYGGLLGCGSENNGVYVYDKRWSEPIWVHGFGSSGGRAGLPGGETGFVSSVCWKQVSENQCNLVAGGSDGVLHVFLGKNNSSSNC